MSTDWDVYCLDCNDSLGLETLPRCQAEDDRLMG